jgi:hypothetical protein
MHFLQLCEGAKELNGKTKNKTKEENKGNPVN